MALGLCWPTTVGTGGRGTQMAICRCIRHTYANNNTQLINQLCFDPLVLYFIVTYTMGMPQLKVTSYLLVLILQQDCCENLTLQFHSHTQYLHSMTTSTSSEMHQLGILNQFTFSYLLIY